ncbi:hypothetical protein Ahy_A02g009079 [Arachis hypogaea]|uniref:Aminotransferase-like plant mobile domain-containing protein n=1 Tax=Arachis hypogaea TaxID=3818 RepID=A0A445EFT5_ARAHY|nr:hypothetical protein Ahy_A02g009079 [Arachis hypogaea]
MKLVWRRDGVRQIPPTDDSKTLRQYARCYIMLLIRRYLMTDKSNNLVHLCWLPLLRDFQECGAFSWGSAVLAWTLVGLLQQSRDQHEARVLLWRVSIDRLRFDEVSFVSALVSGGGGVRDMVVSHPLLWFNIVRFYHVDRVKRQFNGEQQVPGTPVNLDRYLTTTGRGEDVWWPLKLKEWYDRWHQRFEPGRRITVHHTFDTRPTLEY